MTVPMYRSRPSHPESMVVTIREIDGMRTELELLRGENKRLEAEVSELRRDAAWMTETSL